jgi:hypothetical protein
MVLIRIAYLSAAGRSQYVQSQCRPKQAELGVKAIAGRSPGGRPLRRRREMRSVYGWQRLRGTAASKAPAIVDAAIGS